MKTKLVKESLKQKSVKSYLVKIKEEVKDVIRDYFKGFLINGEFDDEAYEDSAMEGDLIDSISAELLDDNKQIIMIGDDEAYKYVDELVNEVLEEPGMEEIKEYFEGSEIGNYGDYRNDDESFDFDSYEEDEEDEDEDYMDKIDREYDD